MPPAVLVCADWSIDARRREVYRARVSRRAIVRLNPPVGGWTLASLLREASAEAQGRSALVGIDVPLGMPASLADALGPAAGPSFLDVLRHVGSMAGFFGTCTEVASWSPRGPFFSADAGVEGLRRWTRQMEVYGVSAYRAIDLATGAKSPLVVSGFPGTVGAGARDVWRTLLADVEGSGARVWPFQGCLAELTAAPGLVLGEIHPRVAYGIALTAGTVAERSRLTMAKSDEDCRTGALGLLQQAAWVRDHGVVLGGLDAAQRSDDAFDALLSAAALLRCVLEGTPLDSARTHPIEGGILGTDSLNLALRERMFRAEPRVP